MKIMLETTTWADNFGESCNHVYVFNDSMTKAMGYVPRGSKTLQRFSKPMSIDTRGRTFVELEGESETQPEPDVTVVEGSKGQKYYLSNEGEGWLCTCPGFKFRGACKHVAEKQQ
jgi:uncharacterized Zn finger protein